MEKKETPPRGGSGSSKRSSKTTDDASSGVDTFSRRPPQDTDAEVSVLGAMMLSKEAIDEVVDLVKGPDFYKPSHELVFSTIARLYMTDPKAPIDAVTVANRLQEEGQLKRIGGAEYIHTLIASVPTVAGAGYYAKIVREQAILRRLVEAGTRITNMAFLAEGEVETIVDTAQEEVFAVDKTVGSDSVRIVGDLLEESVRKWSEGADDPSLSTGFSELDELIGGLQPGSMIVVAGRPSTGKSMLAMDFARHVSVNLDKPTVFFSLEMLRDDLTKRLLSAMANIQARRIGKPKELNRHEWEKIAKATAVLNSVPLYFDDQTSSTVMDIRSKCRRLQRRNGLSLVVIDYLGLLRSSRRFETRQLEVAEYSRSLKLLALELGVPVVVVSQLNRAPEARSDRRPWLSDLRDSGSIEQDADVVLFVHREDIYDKDARPGETDLIVAKNRSGPIGTVVVRSEKEYMKHVEMRRDL